MKVKLLVPAGELNKIVPKELTGEAEMNAARLATFSVLAVMKQRIFNDQGSTNADGNKLGKYSEGYLKTRAKKQHRTNGNINLVFSGETSRDFTLGIDEDGDAAIGFLQDPNGNKKNPNAAQKAAYLEDANGLDYGDIFEANDAEIDLWVDIFEDELFKSI